jgi:hypothetical protein
MKLIHTSKIITLGFLTLLASCHPAEGMARLKSWLPFGNRAQTTQEQIKATGGCAICLQDFTTNERGAYDLNKLTVLNCHQEVPHIFHTECIEKWINAGNSCPLCRNEPVTSNNIHKDAILFIAASVLAVGLLSHCNKEDSLSLSNAFNATSAKNLAFLSMVSLACFYLYPKLFCKREDRILAGLFGLALALPFCELVDSQGKSLGSMFSFLIKPC